MNGIGSAQMPFNRNEGTNLGYESLVSGLGKCKILDNFTYTLSETEVRGSITQQIMGNIKNITQRKRIRFLDIPAKGGYVDEYWEIDMGDEIVRIQKPKDPIADLREMGKNVKYRSVKEAKEQIRKSSIKELEKKLDKG